MGVTCSARDRGCVSLNHSVALNLNTKDTRPTFYCVQTRREPSRGHLAVPLDFTGELDGAADVPAVQVELRVEVLLGCDGCGVVRTGTLGHVALRGAQRRSCKSSSEGERE